MDTRNKSECQVQLSDWRLLIEALSTKLEVDREKLRRHKAEIDDLKASEV
ncbi:hypothetical protein TorRG33x02_032200 [Trema orientale]|uniref:Uncharacterized protein n=1 Tax=Trema orientale TaxID=63057 RepID=A0A2P5FTC8_TREOI|nr:hypothetical protein TorRG33x02_032200 [Trema orientale]